MAPLRNEFPAGIPVVEQDPTDPEFVQNPYPFYDRIRSMGDFVFWKDYPLVVATTHTAVHKVLKHPKMGRAVPETKRVAAPAGLAAFYALEAHSLLEIEPPDHSRIRRLVTRGFTSERLFPIAPDISRNADALIDKFPDGPFDLIEAYSRPLAALTITTFLGVPDKDAPRLQVWSNDMVAMYQARRDSNVERRAEIAALDFTAYARTIITERRGQSSRGDFLSMLIEGADQGALTDDELVSTVILLLNAGHEATAHSVGNAVNLLAAYPDRLLSLHPEQIANTVEECLRFAPPLHLFKRHVYDAVTIDEVSFQPGDQVGALLGSACRDDAVWPDGNRFDPLRARRQHVAFGLGLHACVGAPLARMEMQIALPALFSRCPNMKIIEKPRLADLYHFHGLEKLMVTVR